MTTVAQLQKMAEGTRDALRQALARRDERIRLLEIQRDSADQLLADLEARIARLELAERDYLRDGDEPLRAVK